MAENTLLFPAVTGFVLLAIAAAVLLVRDWRTRPAEADGRSMVDAVGAAVGSPTTWTVLFLLLVLVGVVGAVGAIGGFPVDEATQSLAGSALIGVGALVLAGFVFGGVYGTIRDRGYGSAPAVGVAAAALGFVVLLVVVVQLFLA